MQHKENEAARFEAMLRPMEGQVLGTLWRILRNPEETDDAHQDFLLRVWKQWRAVERHPNPRALLLRICVQCAYDMLRRRKRTGRSEDLSEFDQSLADPAPSPAEFAISEQRTARVVSAIARLPKKQAVAVSLRVLHQQSYEEIAAALGCREATARTHVARGGQAVLDALRKWDGTLSEE